MDARDTLEALISRLGPRVEATTPGDVVHLGDVVPPGVECGRRARLHFASAFNHAKAALDSKDPKRIDDVALSAPTFERIGWQWIERQRELEAKQGQVEARRVRRSGGLTRGAQQRAKAAKAWEPYRERFRQLIKLGKSPGTARQIVKSEMSRAGFTVSFTVSRGRRRKAFPCDRTIAKWLK